MQDSTSTSLVKLRTDHPETHLALKHLRRQLGLSRRDVSALAQAFGGSISEVFLAQCEADPTKVGAKAWRRPSQEKLRILLTAMGSTPAEWESLLNARPWDDAARRATTPRSVVEGDEWDDPNPKMSALRLRATQALSRCNDERALSLACSLLEAASPSEK